ncbi:MAG: hypothetical protein ACKN81_12895, partial [Pirellulaceae bacterium]
FLTLESGCPCLVATFDAGDDLPAKGLTELSDGPLLQFMRSFVGPGWTGHLEQCSGLVGRW